MRKIILLALLLFATPCLAQQAAVVGPLSPCAAFGTTAGTCAQGNDSRITGAAPAASPTFTGTVTMPDASTWTSSGISALKTLQLLKASGDAGLLNVQGGATDNVYGTFFNTSGGIRVIQYNGSGGIATTAAENLRLQYNAADVLVFTGSTGANIFLSSTSYANCTALTTSSNTLSCTASDKRLKDDEGIVSLFVALWHVLRLPDLHIFEFKTYKDWDDTTKKMVLRSFGPHGQHYGFWAQDVAKVEPELVKRGDKTWLTPDGELLLDKGELAPLLFPALKALAAIAAFLLVWNVFLTYMLLCRKGH